MRELDRHGFLDEQIESVRDEIMARHLLWEEAALFLNSCAMQVWTDWRPVAQPSKGMRYSNGLMAKALSSYQGAIHLARIGMIAESITLSRTTLECAAWLGYFSKSKVDALTHFEGDEYLSQHGRMQSYAAAAAAAAAAGEVSSDWRERAEALKREGKTLGRILPSEVLEKANLGAQYLAFYKHFSGTAAHASISSVDRHLIEEAEDCSTLGPDVDEAEKAYFWAIQAMSIAAATYSRLAGTSVTEAQLEVLDKHWTALIQRVGAKDFSG